MAQLVHPRDELVVHGSKIGCVLLDRLTLDRWQLGGTALAQTREALLVGRSRIQQLVRRQMHPECSSSGRRTVDDRLREQRDVLRDLLELLAHRRLEPRSGSV